MAGGVRARRDGIPGVGGVHGAQLLRGRARVLGPRAGVAGVRGRRGAAARDRAVHARLHRARQRPATRSRRPGEEAGGGRRRRRGTERRIRKGAAPAVDQAEHRAHRRRAGRDGYRPMESTGGARVNNQSAGDR